MKCIGSLVDMCVAKGYITQDQAPWLYYGMEKRVSTVIVSIPMLIIGSLVSSPATSIAFYISFCLLRTRTNGIHAKTLVGCLVVSTLSETIFLGFLPYILNASVGSALLITSAISIFILAPYNHPNMDLSDEEVKACAKSAKERLFILILLLIILYEIQLEQLATGILLGIVMVAVSLALAYIKGGK